MKARNRLLRFAVLLCLPALVAGCAFGTRHAVLPYPPPPAGGTAVAEAAPAAAPAALPIILIPFGDARSDREHIGEVKTGLGMKTAWVLADNDVVGWVNEAVAKELAESGFQVTRAASATGTETAPVLSGDVIRVYGVAYMTYSGEVSLSVRVMSGGTAIHTRTYTSQKSAGLSMTASGGGYANALAMALEDDIHQLVADLKGVMPKP